MTTLEEIKEKLNKEESIPKENKELALRIVEFFYKKDCLIKFKNKNYIQDKILVEVDILSLNQNYKKIPNRLELLHCIENCEGNQQEGKYFNLNSSYPQLIQEIKYHLRFYRLSPDKSILDKKKKKSNTPLINLDLED